MTTYILVLPLTVSHCSTRYIIYSCQDFTFVSIHCNMCRHVPYVMSNSMNFKIVLYMAHALMPVQLRNHCTLAVDLVETYSIHVPGVYIPFQVEIFVFIYRFSKRKAMDSSSSKGISCFSKGKASSSR